MPSSAGSCRQSESNLKYFWATTTHSKVEKVQRGKPFATNWESWKRFIEIVWYSAIRLAMWEDNYFANEIILDDKRRHSHLECNKCFKSFLFCFFLRQWSFRQTLKTTQLCLFLNIDAVTINTKHWVRIHTLRVTSECVWLISKQHPWGALFWQI